MRLTDSPEEAAWRQEVRDFLDKNLPESLKQRDENGPEGRIARNRQEEQELRRGRAGGEGFRRATGAQGEWRQRLYEKGWVAPAWPKEYGGAEMSVMEQF